MFENTLLYTAYDSCKSNMIFVNALANALSQYVSGSSVEEGFGGDSIFKKTTLAYCNLIDRVTKEYPKPEFGIKKVKLNDKEFDVVEEITIDKPFCQLRHFCKPNAPAQKKLLITAPMAGHNATLLHDTVETLLPYYDTYITDWVNAKHVPLSDGTFDFDDYIDYIIQFMKHLSPNLAVLAICQPTVPALAALSIMSAVSPKEQLPSHMVLMGGPIDTRAGITKVDKFATQTPLLTFASNMISRVPSRYAGAGRRVYPGFMNLGGFMSMNISKHMSAHLKFFSDVIAGDHKNTELHTRFYDEYLATCDMTAEFYLGTIYVVFQEQLLARGLLHSRGRLVNPAVITNTNIFIVEGERDDITGVGQTKVALDLCSNLPENKKAYWLQSKVGHYGLFSGSKFRESITPRIRSFFDSATTENMPI